MSCRRILVEKLTDQRLTRLYLLRAYFVPTSYPFGQWRQSFQIRIAGKLPWLDLAFFGCEVRVRDRRYREAMEPIWC